MSRGNLYVVFPDGTVRYGIYNGTADSAHAPLLDSNEFTWAMWRGVGPWRDSYGYEIGAGETVIVSSDYGSEHTWIGKATPDYLTEGFYPDGCQLGWSEWQEALPQLKGPQMWMTYPSPIMGDCTDLIARLVEQLRPPSPLVRSYRYSKPAPGTKPVQV